MLIKELGGEFSLIEKLGRIVPSSGKDVVTGIGDDAAVIRKPNDGDGYLLVTTDTLVAGDHFNTSWSQPEQIGIKAAECNVSDIAAMGGLPEFMFVSLVLTPDTSVEWVEGLYRGLAESCGRRNVAVIGGDTTHGPVETVSITLLGSVSSQNLCLREHAKPGDLLAVTGPLGASSACLALLRRELPASEYLLEKHLTPTCRLDASKKIAPIVNAMIDISDGLASEVNHICSRSGVGAFVTEKDIPLHPDVVEAGHRLGKNPAHFALNGGEDFELLFTVPPEKLHEIDNTGTEYTIVGEITPQDKGGHLATASGNIPLEGGYNHFE